MFGTAANLAQQFGATDDFIERAKTKFGQNFAHFFGDKGHQVDDLFWRPGEFCAQLFVLHTNAHRTGV